MRRIATASIVLLLGLGACTDTLVNPTDLQEEIAPPTTVRSAQGSTPLGYIGPALLWPWATLQPDETVSVEQQVTVFYGPEITSLTLEVCPESKDPYEDWLSVTPDFLLPFEPPKTVTFSIVVDPPNTVPGPYSFYICASANGVSIGSHQSVTIIVEEASTPPPTTIDVDIDIKPGSDPNSINLGSKGKGKAADSNANIPVALFSTADFDATLVDPSTVYLGDLELEDTPVVWKNGKYRASAEYVNDDGLMDMVFHFSRAALLDNLDLTENSEKLFLTGVYVDEDEDEQDIIGEDAVRVIH